MGCSLRGSQYIWNYWPFLSASLISITRFSASVSFWCVPTNIILLLSRLSIINASRSLGTFLAFPSPITSSGPRSSSAFSDLGCWNIEMLVPRKEVVAAVAVGLWSMLSIATSMLWTTPFSDLVDKRTHLLRIGWQLLLLVAQRFLKLCRRNIWCRSDGAYLRAVFS